MAVDVGDLKALTRKFFSLHWNHEQLGCTPPEWSEPYVFQGGSVPNYNKQGLYAFLKGCEITYIGVGVAYGGGKYAGHGIGSRFQSYTRVMGGIHTAVDPRLVDAGAIMTIGFEPEQAYLALALESYLLGRMPTAHNINRPGRSAAK